MGDGDSSAINPMLSLLIHAGSVGISTWVMFKALKELRNLDTNHHGEKALGHKKELIKRLGRPLFQTNVYEVAVS